MLRRGDYVLCNFPFREPAGPGPSPHVVLCAATGRQGTTRFAIVFYTTSQTDFPGVRGPRQYLLVDRARALKLGQKTAFVIDASRIARLPLTRECFPEVDEDGLSIRGHDPEFVTRVEERPKELIAHAVRIAKLDALPPRE